MTNQSPVLMKLRLRESNIADKNQRKFFKDIPRSTHQEASIELSFV